MLSDFSQVLALLGHFCLFEHHFNITLWTLDRQLIPIADTQLPGN